MFDISFAEKAFPKILEVAPVTILLSIVSIIIGLILAIIVVVIREKKIPGLNQFVGILVSFIRGTPMIVQLYVVYYGLPQLLVMLKDSGFNTSLTGVPAMIIAITAYSLNAMANLSESIRAAYNSVDKGQYEAAISVGMRPSVALIKIVIPQLISNLIPNLSNIFVDLIKDTALVYNIGIVEIMAKANIISSIGFKYIETYIDALIIYVLICLLFSKLFQVVEIVVRKKVFHAVS
ncbi:amino acid ABC transporter permease [Fructilactobacillus frigidiflavus]|uniref:amino acid ABC transporter permease n=1 Tax=Fructilactobacillus frigidiflavus TaxID=3242688 RepID=UPI0037566EBB